MKEELITLAMDNQDSICYISDTVTYELLYLNKAARYLTGAIDGFAGRKCYEVLQGRNAPCEFCTNFLLKKDKKYCWEFHNHKFNRTFALQDLLIEVHGRLLRLEWAIDITTHKKKEQELSDKILLEETLLSCIQTLSSDLDITMALTSLLSIVGGYYKAKRAYIFEFDQRAGTMNNIYEWTKDGVSPEINNLQEIPLHLIDSWVKRFEQDGVFFISCLDRDVAPQSLQFEILKAQNIESLMAAPLRVQRRLFGFLGVDDPSTHAFDDRLLRSVCLLIQEDIEKRNIISEMEHMSYTDVLTGLANRNKYMATLRDMEQDPPQCLGVVYLDINGLKAANDTYGHSYGDRLIVRAGEILKDFFRYDVFRTGGDEFVALCRDIEMEPFEAMLAEFRARIETEKELKLSIGSNWREGDLDIRGQIMFADELMYLDKQSYYKSLLAGQPKRRAGEAQVLLDDIAAGMFVVYLQAQVDLDTEKVVGAEALVRRKALNGSLYSPSKFIPVYEAEGIIRHLDFFVLETVCTALRLWKDKGVILPVAVNFSRVTLQEHDIVEKLAELCASYNVEPELIRFEVTESIGRMEISTLEKLVTSIREKGFSISLDDFGAQYSNLAILASLDFDEVKFDKSLTSGLGDNPKSNVIMEHAIGMCHDFRRTASLAEGVETCLQKSILKNYHCRYGQGYLFGKPMEMDEFWNWYQQKADSGPGELGNASRYN